MNEEIFSAWRNFHSIQLLGSSNQKVFLSRPFWNLRIGISASGSSSATALQKKHFWHEFFFFFKKSRIFFSFLCLVVVSVPLCYKYLILYDFLFIKSKASIGVLEKSYLNIRKHSSWCFKKTTAPNFCILCILSSETSSVEFFFSWDYFKNLFRAAIMQAGIHPSNLDVRYLVHLWVLKLNLNEYISVCLFAVTF